VSEYSLAFAESLAKAARNVADIRPKDIDARRTILYLALLSTELSLKAMLEQAGHPVSAIRKRSHNLAALVRDLGKCTVDAEIAPGHHAAVSAARIRSRELQFEGAKPTVGRILDAERDGASKYPGQVRYGPLLRHFPAEVVLEMAFSVIAFARQYWTTLRFI